LLKSPHLSALAHGGLGLVEGFFFRFQRGFDQLGHGVGQDAQVGGTAHGAPLRRR